MDSELQIDSLDRRILACLQRDSRMPFLEIARELRVSGGTVHARVNRLRQAGILKGSRVVIDYEKLGYGVTAFMGIKLAHAGSFKEIQQQLRTIPEIVELHYTTGTYSLFAKVVVPSIRELYELLSGRLQAFEDIQSTETFIILDTPVDRDLELR